MYNISETSKETGLTKHTLRYYEKIELVAIKKDEKGHRIYKQADLSALTFIKCLTKTGMPLDQIKEMSKLALVNPADNVDRILSLLQSHKDKIVADLKESKESLKMIDAKIDLALNL
ncbi:MerR family transcriptional regulator [Gammaproteobacteria bacterium]|jgi:DNA-binding transcriptional MerR regulator|nr:MerR family transcriptional regulator [Gammaproteobacteria bacterium]|tara:strand:+ start:441 stop:791 length:351 start_codon:yes stop_codon:yes gene_type:complete